MRYESDNYLSHHGIIGQKWGVRRFQNEDGTLTEAGKDRYLVGQEYAEEHRKIKKEEIKKLEKRNPLVNHVNRKLEDLRDEYHLDDDGNPTWKTRDRFSDDQIAEVQKQYKALREITKRDRKDIKEKAKEIATQKLIDKYGEEAIKDMEYYIEETQRRDAKTGGLIAGILAAAAAIPIISILITSHKMKKQSELKFKEDLKRASQMSNK